MSDDGVLKATWLRQEKGIRRVGTNADWTPGGNFNIFNIANGCIHVERIWGHVTAVCAGAVLVPFLNFTPAGGGAASALCTLAVGAGHAVDVILTWSGIAAGILTPTAALGHSAVSGTATETWSGERMILTPGIISITNATADATAVIDWYMSFRQFDENTEVTVL